MISNKKSKTIWIWNHYATNTFFEKGGRHYWFAKYLMREGYDVKIFCASTVHNSNIEIDTEGNMYKEDEVNSISYIFVNTPKYQGNGKQRIKNMYAFYKGLYKVSKSIETKYGEPDVILASSVHPLTLVAGIKIGKKLNVPCICEIRDLWPESIVTYTKYTNNNAIIKCLYLLEKWVYKKANALIFTIEGGAQYVSDKGWNNKVDSSKIYHINNGVDLEEYNNYIKEYKLDDKDLEDNTKHKVIYTGSIRKVNDVELLVDVAEYLKSKEYDDIMLLIYGDGPDKERLIEKATSKQLDNIIFKGKVEKKYIPFILSCGNLNLLNGSQKVNELTKYGISANKMFEYIASGHPLLANFSEENYSIINANGIGVARKFKNTSDYGEQMHRMCNLSSEDYMAFHEQSIQCVEKYSFKNLTDKLIDIINKVEYEK